MSKKTPKETLPIVRAATGDDDARVWLRVNEYSRIADQIDHVMLKWRADGKRTRRNWWEILAGHADGKPRIAGGITFPVLRAARIRQGLPPDVPGVLCQNPDEEPPAIRVTPRWKAKRRRSRKRH